MNPTDVLNKVEELQDYVAYCPSCGSRVTLVVDEDSIVPHDRYTTVEMQGTCRNDQCARCWWYSFEIDHSGTFGVYSFECSNGDRDMED